ncbi:MAG: acetylornithine/succinylornithine family transaminase [Fibrobacter sp.]|jgi:predicted acetylornithine/succinylornithine family transaminase|nr:acetylornithine/succinylornithine family transaminase [Fibrobacter sp.]
MAPFSINESFGAQDQKVIAPLYAKANLDFVSGKGSYLFDREGNKYLDFISGIATNALGHCHPVLVEAFKNQLEKLIHLSNLFPNYPQIEFAEKLLTVTGFDKAFFCNSGTEANEGAIKFARKYFNRKGEKDRTQIVTFYNSFHGRTFGALSATGQPALREGFGDMPAGFTHVEWNDTEALKAKVNEKTCAIMLEPLAAEGGILTPSAEMIKTIAELREKFGCLVITDEIQTGVGRLGTFCGAAFYGIPADIATFAKAIGAGLPLGAVLMKQLIADELRAGDHGTTFGGNPVACTGGLALVNIVSEPAFLENVKARSAELKAGIAELIRKFGFLGEARGEGLLLGFTSERPVSEILAKAREEKLLVHRAGTNTVRFLPPLNVSSAEIGEALKKMNKALSAL